MVPGYGHQNSGPEYEARTAAQALKLKEANPYLAHRMQIIRYMIEHRNLTYPQIAKHLKRSREWVYQTLRYSAVRLPGEPHRNNARLPHEQHRRLNEVERAISTLTRRAGGLYASCGCTPATIEELTRQLAGHGTEEFPDAHRD